MAPPLSAKTIVCPHCGEEIPHTREEWGGWMVDLEAGETTKAGARVTLTTMEMKVLAVMVRSQGRVTPRWALMALYENSRTPLKSIDVIIHRLRRKLGPFCETRDGTGRRLRAVSEMAQ